MSDAFDERRRGLEEEYFHRKNKEAIEKLREKMKVAEDAKAAGTSSMKCPRCDGDLKESKFDEVSIDTCGKCGGVWLDSGELERVTSREGGGGFFGRLWNKSED
jgi:Zn-finger nucleic acid-binding protein